MGLRRKLSSLAILPLFAPMLWAQAYTISTFAGSTLPALPAPAASISVGEVLGVASDNAGNLYIPDSALHVVFKVTPSGTATIVAGTGYPVGFEGGTLTLPWATAVDSQGNVFIGDCGLNAILELSASTGALTQITSSRDCPGAIVAGQNNTIYYATDSAVISLSDGVPTLLVGLLPSGYSGDGGPAIDAQIFDPTGLAVDAIGNLYIADRDNSVIRKISTSGIITTFAGNGTASYSGDGGLATMAGLSFPAGVAVDAAGNVYIADSDNSVVRKVSPSGIISTLAGNGTFGFSGDGGPALSAAFNYPQAISVGPNGAIYVADIFNLRIREISSSGTVTTVAGNGSESYSGDNGPALGAVFGGPAGIAASGDGNVYVADFGNFRIRQIGTNGIITTIAGNGTSGYTGDGGPAAAAGLAGPYGVALDSQGDLFIADTSRVLKISTDGVIASIAGTGTTGYSGDGGPAVSANLLASAIGVDASGNVLIADVLDCVVRKISASGEITTIAGTGTGGYSGDNGPATSAQLSSPSGVAVDAVGNLYIADGGNAAVRKISTAGIITTVASGVSDYFIATDVSGNVYFTSAPTFVFDELSDVVQKLSPSGALSTIAGVGGPGSFGDGGLATEAALDSPSSITVAPNGTVYFADQSGAVIRTLTPCLPAFTSPAASDSSAQTINVSLTLLSACPWSATSLPSWITRASSGTGPGTLALTLQANTSGADRSATINVSGSLLSVTQAFTTQTFTDAAPSAYYFDAANLLAGKGITSGCGPSTYCPGAAVTRDDMAIFIVRTILGTGTFTYSPTPYFGDVPAGYFAFPWIQKLYELGITSGCAVAPLNYCPGVTVTRDQMAIFLIRARYGPTTAFTFTPTPYFSDVTAGDYAFDWIQRLYEDSVTAGCSLTPLEYCPGNPVTRGDMAIFVMRAGFNQLLPSAEPTIVSIVPATLAHGATGTFVITGVNTAFQQGMTNLVFPASSGITVNSVTAISATTMQVSLTAASNSPLQPVSIYEQTEPQEAVLPNGLLIQ